jgi:hypothetical protein
MKRLLEQLLTFIGFGPSPCSGVPLRWRVRWFIRGMGSIVVPISEQEFWRDIHECVEEQMKKWREENPPPNDQAQRLAANNPKA